MKMGDIKAFVKRHKVAFSAAGIAAVSCVSYILGEKVAIRKAFDDERTNDIISQLYDIANDYFSHAICEASPRAVIELENSGGFDVEIPEVHIDWLKGAVSISESDAIFHIRSWFDALKDVDPDKKSEIIEAFKKQFNIEGD